MIKTFYLVRHGTKENLAGDPPLSNLGIKQAEITANYLNSLGIKKIYSSPLKRTLQTAQIIADKLKLSITIDDRLTERINWNGTDSFEHFLSEWGKTDLDENYKPGYGFSSIESGKRIKELLDKVSNTSKFDRVLFASHGGVIIDLLLNLFSEDELTNFNKDFMIIKSNGAIPECSITIIKTEDGKYYLEQLASTKHLVLPLS